MARHEVRLAGFGGQGVVLSGYILGKAAALYDGRSAALSQNYGPEARGGACAAEVIIDDVVDYPVMEHPGVLVLMSQEAAVRYSVDMTEETVVLVDQDLVKVGDGQKVHRIPATRLAEELGRRLVANIVMLGFVTAVTGVVGRDAIEEAIRTTVPPKTIDLNMRAFQAGYDYASGAAG